LPAGVNGPSSSSAGDGPTASVKELFGAGLEAALVDACGDRLTHLHWFRTDWQRGGALTGYGQFQVEDQSHEVVAKLPVPPRERRWLQRLQPDQHEADEVAPRLFASGEELGGYDLAWVVMERLPFGPLGSQWDGAEFDLLVEAVGRFYVVAEQVEVDRPPREEDWPSIIARARKHLRERGIADEQRWNKAIKQVQKKLGHMLELWNARDCNHWCHGDLHLANAMTRRQPPEGPALLFDFAEAHAGHWIEDAVYLEHLYWGHEKRLGGRKLSKLIAHERKAHGLHTEAQWPKLAHVRRALLAASVPAYLSHEGDPKHLAGALNVLERTLPQIK